MRGSEPFAPRPPGRAAVAAVALATAAASLVFVAAPGLDLAGARLFYEGGGAFALEGGAADRFFRGAVRPAIRALSLVLLALACLALASRGRLVGWPPRAVAYVGLVYALGPGLLVNGLLKTFIGRARPRDIAEFGGERSFSAAWAPADQCASNCAFVSGDVAFAAGLFALALLARGARRRWALAGALAATLAVAAHRLGVGAHFPSDALLAALLTALVALALARAMFPGPGAPRGRGRGGA